MCLLALLLELIDSFKAHSCILQHSDSGWIVLLEKLSRTQSLNSRYRPTEVMFAPIAVETAKREWLGYPRDQWKPERSTTPVGGISWFVGNTHQRPLETVAVVWGYPAVWIDHSWIKGKTRQFHAALLQFQRSSSLQRVYPWQVPKYYVDSSPVPSFDADPNSRWIASWSRQIQWRRYPIHLIARESN